MIVIYNIYYEPSIRHVILSIGDLQLRDTSGNHVPNQAHTHS